MQRLLVEAVEADLLLREDRGTRKRMNTSNVIFHSIQVDTPIFDMDKLVKI